MSNFWRYSTRIGIIISLIFIAYLSVTNGSIQSMILWLTVLIINLVTELMEALQ